MLFNIIVIVLHLPAILLGYFPAFLLGRFARAMRTGWRDGMANGR